MKKQTILFFIILVHFASAQACSRCRGTCTSQGCSQCEDGFMLSTQGWCGIFTPVEGCRTYDALANACASCNPDRQLIQQRCYILPENCDEVDKFRECLRCKPNFYLQKGKCLTQNVSNCPIGSLAVSGFCQPLRAQNCQKMDDQKICSLCDPNYTLLNGRCLRVTSTTSCNGGRCSCTDGTIFNQLCYVIQIDKCTIKRDGIYCSACERGFVAIDGICLEPVKMDDINCNVVSPTSDYCTGCNQDYFLNIDAFCYRDFYFNATTCPMGQMFTWENGKCLYWDRRCEAIDFKNNYACLRCQEGHYKTNIGKCQRNICTKFVNNICTETFIGYYLNTTKGVNQYEVLPKNCLAVDANQVCIQCSSYTKYLQMAPKKGFVCAYEDVNCVEYNLNGSCINCLNSNNQDGYVLRDRFCFKKAQNCQARDPTDQSKCQICNQGYHLEQSDKKCYIDIPGCEVYLVGSDCKQCAARTYLLYQKKCYATNTECLDYDANNMCRRCIQGMMPFRNICVFFHPYCIQYKDRVCSRAATGWSLGNGMTQAQKDEYRRFIIAGQEVKNRNTAVDTSKFATNTGTYVNGALITRFPYANVIHTKISSVNLLGQITSCNSGYTLINMACIQKTVPNCELYSADEICIRCAANYTLAQDFTCVQGLQCLTPQDVSNGRCLKCAAGYIIVGIQCFKVGKNSIIDQQLLQSNIFYNFTLDTTTYMSWPKILNCKTQQNPVQCSECFAPYQSINGQCIIPIERCVDYGFGRGQTPGICLFCQNGFVLWFGQCRRLMCNPAGGVCQTCVANYYYYFGLCLVNPQPNCRSYDNNLCVLCTPGQYLNSQNQCLPDITGCLTMNRDTGRCLQCRSSMVLYRQRCVAQVIYCQDYNTANQCIRCQQNTVNRTQLLTDNTCGILVGQCAKLNDQTRQCSQCNLGYTPIRQSNTILCVNSKPNCILYDIRGRCTTCTNRFILRNNQCVMYLQFCITLNPDGSACLVCANGTQLDNGCCRVPDRNCISYTQCICTACMTGFYLSGQGRCVQNIQGCDVYDYINKRCTKCSAQYYIQLDGTCQSQEFITNGCQQGFNLTVGQSNQYKCVKCRQGFELNFNDNLCYGYNCNGTFQTTRHCANCPLYYKIYKGSSFNDYQNYCIPYFCETYIPGQNQCQTNITTYYGGHIIITITKTITIEYCLTVDPQGRCTSCQNYRYPNTNTQYNLCYPRHCTSITQFNCTKCQFGYQLNSRFPGSCLASFCDSYAADGSCDRCTLPYTVSSSGICQNKGCCDGYDSVKGVCVTAKKYFFIQNNICVPVNCNKYDPKLLTSCAECQRGYTLFPDGTCRVTNCQQDTFSGQSCVICNRGFKLQTSTTSIKSICLPRYCLEYSKDFNTCVKCAQGFTLDGDQLCRADFCANYQSNLVCQTCIPYFVLNQNERCVADCSVGNVTKCQCCKFGFTLNTTSSLCQNTDEFCIKTNPSSGLCSQCTPTYNLISGKCIAPVTNCQTPSMFGCLSCRAGYDLVDSCRCVPKYCNLVGSDGKCARCHPRFQLTPEGLCKTRDCQFFNVENWACNGCYNRFIYVDNICVTTNCQFWEDFQNTTCKVCNSTTTVSSIDFSSKVITYNLTFGACYISFCKTDPRELYCKQCVTGYKLTTTGLCECSDYDKTNNICKCPAGYIFNKNTSQCQINRDICLQRNSNNTCLVCPFQYQDPIDNGQCVPLFCQKWELTAPGFVQCRKCYNNFNLINGFCVNSLCNKFENKSGLLFPQCTSCQQGWTPYSNICIPSRCQPTTYNIQTGICINCTGFGYILSSDKKKCVVANCQIDLPPDQCAKCKLGYYNFTGLCIASNCTIFDEVTCQGCVDGYVLKNQLCYAVNCENFGENNFCLECNDGYTLVQNYTCVRDYCQVDGKDKCQKCIKGYTYHPTLLRCVPVNCQKYPPKYQTCQVCLSGYYKQNNTCMDIRCDITQFTQQYKCLKCQTGYQFNKDNLCYPINPGFCPAGRYFNTDLGACVNIPISDCRIFINKRCMWCSDGFFLYNNLCYSTRFCSKWSYYYGCYQCFPTYYLQDRQCKLYKQDPNCQESANNTCIKCKQGYQLWSGRCILLPANCQEVDQDGNCVKCMAGYVVNGGVCQSSDPNCLAYNGQGKCTRCVDGYYAGVSGQCLENPVNCTRADANGKCLQCVKGYALQNGRCFKQLPFCQKYSQSTQFCVGCISNFTLLGIQCQCGSDSQFILNRLCIKLPPNCIQINPNTFVCIKCARNFVLTPDFRCTSNIVPPENCNIYDPQTGICKQCFPNFILTNNTCRACLAGQVQVGNQCFTSIVGCRQYLSNGGCKTCLDGYRLDNNKCVQVQVPPFCAIYDPATGICQKCITGYNITNNGLSCTINNCLTSSPDGKTCIKCLDKFTWNGKQCQFTTQYCLAYTNGFCTTCDTFATLNQSRCIPNFCNVYDYLVGVCSSCLDKYVLVSRRCYIIIIGCNDYLNTGSCRVCAQGYNLINGLCVKIQVTKPQFCTQFNPTTNICTACAPGYTPTPDGKLCIFTNCQSMNPTSTLCTKCTAPFQWNGQACIFQTDFCVSYSNVTGYCSSCLSFANLMRNRCVPGFCSGYNYNVGVCESCNNGYTLSLTSKRCFVIIIYCVSYGDTGLCTQCQDGYIVTNNGVSCVSTTPPVVPGCFAQTGRNCTRCRHRYYLDTQICSAYIPYCINIDPYGKCVSCCFGSTLINGRCQRDTNIKYCASQNGNTCQQCLPNYNYCAFCEACLPPSPNCNRYGAGGDCAQCIDNFVLLNGVCVSLPVGFVAGAAGTCRAGYYSKDGNCYRNLNDLRLYSQVGGGGSLSTDSFRVRSDVDPLIIFGILITTSSSMVSANSSFILYYRSKISDPMVCWNSCVPTKIDNRNYAKELVYPIIASEVIIYLLNQNIQSTSFDLRVL